MRWQSARDLTSGTYTAQTGSVFGQRTDGEHTQLEYRCRGFYGMVMCRAPQAGPLADKLED